MNSKDLTIRFVVPSGIAEIRLTQDCTEYHSNNDHKYCGRCPWTGKMLTKEGQVIIDLVKQYGEFAEKEPSYDDD